MDKQKVNGVILIDKPQGMTSQQVVSKVKYLFMSPAHNSKKAGHTGTLDPMATGLLPVCLGESTKFSHYQLDADKSYQAVIKLGIQTDTGDAEGQITAEQAIADIDELMLKEVTAKFTGAIKQIPPMYSALKKDGKKLYQYAREGIEIDRPARDITIKALTLVKLSADELLLKVTCTKGTYVRVLGEDIAKALGTLGHLTVLRRTAVGRFSVADAITPEQLEAQDFATRFDQLMAVDACIDSDKTPYITLDDDQIKRIRNGQRLNVYQQVKKEWFHVKHTKNHDEKTENAEHIEKIELLDVRMLDADNTFVGLGALEVTGRLQPTKVVNL